MAQLYARPTGDQEVAGSTPAEVGNILSWRLITKYFLRSFPSADSRRAVASFWRKNVHNTGWPLSGLSLPSKSVVRYTDCARHDPIGLTGPKIRPIRMYGLLRLLSQVQTMEVQTLADVWTAPTYNPVQTVEVQTYANVWTAPTSQSIANCGSSDQCGCVDCSDFSIQYKLWKVWPMWMCALLRILNPVQTVEGETHADVCTAVTFLI